MLYLQKNHYRTRSLSNFRAARQRNSQKAGKIDGNGQTRNSHDMIRTHIGALSINNQFFVKLLNGKRLLWRNSSSVMDKLWSRRLQWDINSFACESDIVSAKVFIDDDMKESSRKAFTFSSSLTSPNPWIHFVLCYTKRQQSIRRAFYERSNYFIFIARK